MDKEVRIFTLRVVEWRERYEVNKAGRAAKDGDELRAAPLLHIRSAVHGHHQGPGYRRMVELAGSSRAAQVFGVFQKCLEVAASNTGDFRGWVLDHRNNPATPESLAFSWSFPVEQIEFALSILTHPDVAWLEWATRCASPQNSVTDADVPECPQNSVTLQKAKAKRCAKEKEKKSESNAHGRARETGTEQPVPPDGPSPSPNSLLQEVASPSPSLTMDTTTWWAFRADIEQVTGNSDRGVARFLGWLSTEIISQRQDEWKVYRQVLSWVPRVKEARKPAAYLLKLAHDELGFDPRCRSP